MRLETWWLASRHVGRWPFAGLHGLLAGGSGRMTWMGPDTTYRADLTFEMRRCSFPAACPCPQLPGPCSAREGPGAGVPSRGSGAVSGYPSPGGDVTSGSATVHPTHRSRSMQSRRASPLRACLFRRQNSEGEPYHVSRRINMLQVCVSGAARGGKESGGIWGAKRRVRFCSVGAGTYIVLALATPTPV